MKISKFNMVSLAIVAIACFAAQRANAAGECAADPDACSGPRTWSEDFNDGTPLVPSDDWQARNGTSPQPSYSDGKAHFDGFTDGPWVIIDSTDWLFEGESTVNVVMDANPNVGNPDSGAGWWINADNEATDGGYYAVYGVLERNELGEQQYRFGDAGTWGQYPEFEVPDNLIIPIAEGSGIDASITVDPGFVKGDPFPDDPSDPANFPEDFVPSMARVSYSITDSAGTYTGDFLIPPRFNPPGPRDQKWLTLFSFADGWGVFDSIEVINEGRTSKIGDPDLNFDGNVDGLDLGILLGAWDPAVAAAMGVTQAGAVPEPTSIALLAVASLSLIAVRKRS